MWNFFNIILIVLVLVVAIILAIVFIPKTDKVNKLLENEANQINILTEIYNDFLNRTNFDNDENIVSLELIRDDELEKCIQKYEIYVEDGTLKFKSDNLMNHLMT